MTNWSIRTSEFDIDSELRLENVADGVHTALLALRGASMLTENDLDLGENPAISREEIEAALGCSVPDLIRLARAAQPRSATGDIAAGSHTLHRDARGKGAWSYVHLGSSPGLFGGAVLSAGYSMHMPALATFACTIIE